MIGLQWFLFVVLICISLRTVICAGLHMLICHMYIFFGEGSDQNFAHQKFLLLMLNFKSFLYILDFSPLSELHFTNIFLILWFVFSFTWHWLSQSRSFNFNEVQLIVVFFFYLWIVPLVLYVRSHCQGFPGGPVVRTLYFHCTGYGFDPWLGN